VKSSDGFSWIRKHRFYADYIEGERTMEIDVEGYFDPDKKYKLIIYTSAPLRWLPPHAGAPVSEEKISAIKKNISDTMTFMGTEYTFM
jgi:hypothetical protein